MTICEEHSTDFPQDCKKTLQSVSDALYVVGGKWKLQVIIALANNVKRFNELQRTITGISARVLSNELKELEINGFLKRVVNTSTKPVSVEYELTEYSNSLREVVMALSSWGLMHRTKIISQGKEQSK